MSEHFNFIKEGAPVFAEKQFKQDKRAEPSPKQRALSELLVACFAGEKPNAADVKILSEGRTPQRGSLKQQRKGQRQEFTLSESDAIPGFNLPHDLGQAEAYVDGLIANGTNEYTVWKNCQAAFAQR